MFWDDDSWLIVTKCFHMFSSRWFLGHFRGRDSIVMVLFYPPIPKCVAPGFQDKIGAKVGTDPHAT